MFNTHELVVMAWMNMTSISSIMQVTVNDSLMTLDKSNGEHAGHKFFMFRWDFIEHRSVYSS